MKKHIIVLLILISAALSSYIGYQRYKKPLVSVVMLTYKRADIVPQAIESVLAQTFKDFEFIILNDGSPDNTAEVIKKYADIDSRIRYYENDTNKGIAYSRNRAASLARGKYIMIMDDDDISFPERMEKQVKFLEENLNITAVAGQILHLPRIPQYHDLIATSLIQYNNFGNANIMYRRKFALDHDIKYDETLRASEDWDFWLQVLFAGGKLSSLNDDILIRDGATKKHYSMSYEEANVQVRDKIGKWFNSQNSNAFYQANSCQKLKMIANKNILSPSYIDEMLKLNCQPTL